jgi:hypothetical protein
MDQWWIYASAGVAGFLWGIGYIQQAVALAFIAGLLLGAGDAAKWAVLAVIASYIIGSMMIGRRQTAT